MEENNKGCLDRIREKYSSLNRAEKKAAQYILENPKNIIHFSITELSEASGVSETTVFRLCNSLDFKGYQDLKINLAGSLITPMENFHEEISAKDDAYIIMRKVLNGNILSMEETIRLNPPERLEEAVKLLDQAKTVMFFGMGGSAPLCEDAHHKFIRTGISGRVASDPHWQAMYVSMAEPGDVLVAISSTGSNKALLEAVQMAKEKGVKVIAITSHARSPIGMEADISLLSYGRESDYRSEAMESRVTTLMLIDSLYLRLALLREEETMGNLNRIRKSISEKRF